jgi:uncharacterized cupin superfamily protein
MRDCAVVDTGWRSADKKPLAFEQHADELAVSLTRVSRGEHIRPVSGIAEEMGAVLEGRFALICGDETHMLAAGDGILIPRGEARAWQLMSERGVLYRVWRYADAAP